MEGPWRDKKDKARGAGGLKKGTQLQEPQRVSSDLGCCVYEHVTVWGEGWGRFLPAKEVFIPPASAPVLLLI